MKIRKAFVMSVRADAEHEYEKRHNPILSLGRWQVRERVRDPSSHVRFRWPFIKGNSVLL